MNPQSTLDHKRILKEFTDKLNECTRTAVCGRQFVLVGKLQEWLRSPAPTNVTHITRQVYLAYRKRSRPNLPISPNVFDAGSDCCLLVFCILHMIGSGDLIDAFTEKGKLDRHLPLSQNSVESIFQTVNASHLTAEFIEKQHRFCPARFNFQRTNIYNKDVVIPICNKTPINEGGTAHLWLIEVPEEFVERDLRIESSRSRFNAATQGSDPDWRYEFALKTFISKDQDVFENEKEAFISLKGHKGMVKYLASFRNAEINDAAYERGSSTNSSPEHQSTSNILLEFADMDLSVYFQNRLPPALSKEVEEFWKALFAIANAVRDIHNLKEDRGDGIREYDGWHSDIKPDNILNVEDTGTGICKFKLADPGFAQFEPKDRDTKIPKRKLWGGTKTYGPPEYPGQSEHPVSQAIDIWSLGCVFSLAATWVVLGFVGILQFNEVRKMKIEEIHRSRRSQNPADEDPDGDQFHDGYELLQIVTLWHHFLRGRMRKCDAMSVQVLDLVDNKMLITNPDDRIKADDLCSNLERMLAKGSKDSTDSVPIEIQLNLKDIDAKIANRLENLRHSKAADQGTVNGTIPKSRKQSPIDFMLKTTHRQSILPSKMLQIQQGRQSIYSKAFETALDTHLEASQSSSLSSHPSQDMQPLRHQRAGPKTSKKTPKRTSTARKSSQHPPQDVWQAREAVENREKRNSGIFPTFLKHHHLKKDEVLANYFDQRDIKFLVDNAESMRANWFHATYLLETLVMKAKGQDPDGMDLNFTSGTAKVEQKEKSSVFVNRMKDGYPKAGVITNMVDSLSKILNQYLYRLRYSRNRTNDVTLIVLTDGLWAGTTREDGVKKKIMEFLEELHRLHHNMKHRPFSIEFVQFGNNLDATKRLKYLDNFLREKKTGKRDQDISSKYKDMIDTEHALGDVNKMLLGSFVEAYDEDEEIDSNSDSHSSELEHASPGANNHRKRSPPFTTTGTNGSWSGYPHPPPDSMPPPGITRASWPYGHAIDA